MKIYTFGEGDTEKNVFQRLEKLVGIKAIYVPANGKSRLNQKVVEVIETELGAAPVGCVIFRDLDSHDHETLENLVKGISNKLKEMFHVRGFESSQVRLSPHQDHPNVFTLQTKKPNLSLAFHVMDYRWQTDFIKSTIDDYILHLALLPATAAELSTKLKKGIEASQLIKKITEEIPELMKQNGLELKEAKDYVRFYSAVIQSHTSPAVFAQKILAHAQESDIRQICSALIASIEFVRSGGNTPSSAEGTC